uniref:C2 domain-containing protein n=1 Tax=Trichobilharzia regenti TaxID=157069 RepID=A0AA85JZ34_TRIRE|nr:unnamed protein product [Trichobilharzia regenti]CAH8833867.1 unnamed protein product [Trichobilharzia regenti]
MSDGNFELSESQGNTLSPSDPNEETSKVKPLGVNNKTLSRYFDKMLDTLINKTENKKMLEETVSTPNENGSESQSPKEQGHEETGNENGVGVLSGSGTTNGVDKQITIDPISTGLITNNDHDVTVNKTNSQNYDDESENQTGQRNRSYTVNIPDEKLINMHENLSSSCSQLTMSPPLSLGDEVNSPGLAASTDDLLSLDQYDPYEQRTKNLSVNESLASSCLNIISQNQDGSERTRNDSTLERWLSQSELLKPVTKLKNPFPRDGYFWSVALFIKLGRRLIPLNSKGRSDPYVKIKHTGSVLARSRMVPNNSNPVWDEKFWFRLCSLELPIELKVYHRDAFKKDSYIGRTLVSLLDIEMDREYEFVSRLENEVHKIPTSGEIKFYITLSEIDETCLDSSECKKLKKKLKEEKARAFSTDINSQSPREASSTQLLNDNYSTIESIAVPSVYSGSTASLMRTWQGNRSNHDSIELNDPTDDLQSEDGQQQSPLQTPKQLEKNILSRLEDKWIHENQSLLLQPIWPYSFYEGTNLELYTNRYHGGELESIDKLHSLNNEIQMESLFQQSRLIITLVGAKNLKSRGRQRNCFSSDLDNIKLSRLKSLRGHNSESSASGYHDDEKSNLPCPIASLTVGMKTQQSKAVMHTKNPLWNERFEFRVRPGMKTVLQCEVFDDSHQNGNLLGRFYLEFSKLVLDWTTCFTLKNQESRCHGELHILATMTGLLPIVDSLSLPLSSNTISRSGSTDQLKRETESIYGDLSKEGVSKLTLDQIHDYYKVRNTLKNSNDIGWLRVVVHRATNLPAKDRSGKSNAFCEIRLVNRVVRTFTAPKNAYPIWNQAFVFPISDMYSILEVYIYEEGKETSEITGRVSFPLIQLVNRRQKWYALKDKSLTTLAKGSILLETIIIYNPLKASLRALYPKEKRYYVEDSKVKLRDLTKKHLPLIQRNIDRLTPFIDDFKRGHQIFKRLYSWERPFLSFIALVLFEIIVLYVQPYMVGLSIAFIMIIMRIPIGLTTPLSITSPTTKSFTRTSRSKDSESEENDDDQDIIHPENYAYYSDMDNEDEAILRKKKDKKTSFTTKLNKIRSILGTLQDAAEQITSFLERLDYLCRWRYPWLTCLAVIIVLLVSLLLYLIPLRYLIVAYTIRKFTRAIRNQHRPSTTIFLGILNRVPSRMEKIYYRELRPITTPPTNLKTPGALSSVKASGLQVYSRMTGYHSNAE